MHVWMDVHEIDNKEVKIFACDYTTISACNKCLMTLLSCWGKRKYYSDECRTYKYNGHVLWFLKSIKARKSEIIEHI